MYDLCVTAGHRLSKHTGRLFPHSREAKGLNDTGCLGTAAIVSGRGLTRTPRAGGVAVGAMAASVGLMVLVGIQGPSTAVARFPAAPPWPPCFFRGPLSPALIAAQLWMAILLGALGLVTGLVAVRHGWRPRPRR